MSEKVILCIDDEKIVLDSLKAQLNEVFRDEFLLEFAESADEGLEVLEEVIEDGAKVLLVVSDWLMPGMRGDEFLVQVHKKYPHIIKMLLTGQADDDAVIRAKEEANLYALLQKPWDKNKLIRSITEALDQL